MSTVKSPASMPATLEALARSLNVYPETAQRLAAFVRASRQPFREIVDPALEGDEHRHRIVPLSEFAIDQSGPGSTEETT